MADYRDAFRASLERVDRLQHDLMHARGGEDVAALRIENELLHLDREWRDKQESLAFVQKRRQKLAKIASAILFLVLALAGIALLAMGMTAIGVVCFVASVAGWVIAGVQESRFIQLMRVYEEDRRRIDRTLSGLRVALETRVAEDPAPETVTEAEPEPEPDALVVPRVR
jgi:hypothetical protein